MQSTEVRTGGPFSAEDAGTNWHFAPRHSLVGVGYLSSMCSPKPTQGMNGDLKGTGRVSQ